MRICRWLLTALVLSLFFTACSTQRNTWMTRHFQELNTRYNIHFNANEAYKQGLNVLEAANPDEYTNLLPMYIISNHSKAKNAEGNLNKAIEKCQLAIRKRSIRVKPTKKPTTESKASYKRFYTQEEFNPFTDEVYLLMANAQFHKADFNSSAATSNYIMRHFLTNKKACDLAALLQARSNKELGWQYEAENAFNNLNTPALTPSLNGKFAAGYADFLISTKQYRDAIPYLSQAIGKTSNKKEKQRWTFLLGQLYQETGQQEQAYTAYGKIPGMNPPYAMEISARILQTEVLPANNPTKPLKKLLRMSKSRKNKDNLDQIHYAMGNLYLAIKDTLKAKENYQLSLDKSTKYGATRLKTYLTYGDLLYRMNDFRGAYTCYSKANTMLNKEDERYEMATMRYTILKDLAPQLTIIHNEDSLLQLSVLPKAALDRVIDSLVTMAEKRAKEERRKQLAVSMAQNQPAEDAQQDGNQPTITDPTNKSWYFYNPSLVTKGLSEFQKKWGKRELNDDWRRNKKTSPFTQQNDAIQSTTASITPDSIVAVKDSVAVIDTVVVNEANQYKEGADNPLKPNFYLKNIPFTVEQKQASYAKLAASLFKVGTIYREQMSSDRLSLAAFKELETRFPESEHLEKAWYITYLMLKQSKNDESANEARVKLINKFPGSPLAERLNDSLFIEHLAEMYQLEDSVYEATYKQFTLHHTDSVLISSQYVKKRYPLTSLMPKFLFLESLELGRTGQFDAFHDTLTTLVKRFPKSDVTPVAKAMLDLWNKGQRPAVTPGYTGIMSRIDSSRVLVKQRRDSLASKLLFTPGESHVLLIVYNPDSVNAYRLQFDVALYNFTAFLIRDYELKLAKIGQMDVLLVQGFENAADVLRYASWINFQNESPDKKYPGIRLITVSTKNLNLFEQGLTPDSYMPFFNKMYQSIQTNP